MALIALTTADTVDFVSVLDGDAKTKLVPNDPNDHTKGTHPEVVGWDEGASVFKLSSLDVYLMGHIYDNATQISGKSGSDEVGISTKVNKTNIDAVRYGLVGIPDNFCTKDGRPVELRRKDTLLNGRKYQVVEDAVLDQLGLQLIGEMAGRIKAISEVQKAEAKN